MPSRAAALGHLPEAQVGLPVKAGVGLVEQQQLRIVQQRQREVELLAGPARQFLDAVAEVLREAELVEQPVARRVAPSGRRARRPRANSSKCSATVSLSHSSGCCGQ